MLNTNLVLPLLALGMYSHCHNINLANNTSLLIIVLALALQQREISKIEDNMSGDNTSTFSRTTNTTFNSNNGQTTFSSSSNFPYSQPVYSTCPFSNNSTWTTWSSSCPCQNNNWQTFSTPTFSTQSCQNGHCFVTPSSSTTVF